MVSHLPSSSERQINNRPGNSAPSKAGKAHNTPRKEGGVVREKSVQESGLKDYRLGECLGKGAFGSVYKAFNWGTGEAVAIKQIKLGDLPKSELRMIEAEIDLLKNLNHDNIVKYLGFVKSRDCLNIILEYCENGSLHSICKSYGKFPENLVGVYMGQILHGLLYLHDQGVIHRDIKGANILTTKDGKVKLADFGVSTSTLVGADKEAQVVGTPYWMAPEIIQLSGATPASDIWSLGCTVIELLEGRPPYHKLAPMPALFAIVNDDHPPLPEGVSPAARDFLIQCFQKDPNLRVSARKLLKHAWIVGSRRTDAPVAKLPANFSEAVEEVKQWNEALRSPTSGGSFRASKSNIPSPLPHRRDPPLRKLQNNPQNNTLTTPVKGQLSLLKPRDPAEAFRSPDTISDDNWDDDFASSISPSALQLPHLKPHDNFAGLLSAERLKTYASIDSMAFDESGMSGGDPITIKGPLEAPETDGHELETIRPYHLKAPASTNVKPSNIVKEYRRKPSTSVLRRPKSPVKVQAEHKFVIPSRPATLYREQSLEDYSDIWIDSDSVFERKLNNKNMSPPTKLSSASTDSLRRRHGSVDKAKMQHHNLSLLEDQDPSLRRTRSSVEIQRYAEGEDDEDFSDIFFDDQDTMTQRSESDYESEDGAGPGALMLHSKLSNSSWLGDEDDDEDVFASMDQGFDEMDLQTNIARDKHARLCTLVEGLVSSLKTTEAEDILTEVSEQLLDVLYESEDAESMIISAHGMLPILEILEPCTVKSKQGMILQLLKVVNLIISNHVEIQENLCFVGGIPVITKFTARQYANDIRREAASFVRQMFQTSTLTLQMFVSAGGLNVLIEFLDEDYEEARELVLIGVDGIWNVFELQGPTPKNDFCRILSRNKILSPLALVLENVLDEGEDRSQALEGRIVGIFYFFSQAENYVKEVVADHVVLKRVLKGLSRMTPQHQITMLKFIKNLSMLSTTLESLHAAHAIELLIDLLSASMKKASAYFREISNQVLNTMFNLCRLSKIRQEDAAANGIIPLLLRIMKKERPPKEFALPILCDMAHSGKVGRKYLWQNKGLQFYVSLLDDQYWQVTALDAIFIWLQEETARVEKCLLEGNFTPQISHSFHPSKSPNFDYNLLEPLQKLLRLSSPVAASLARPDIFTGILQKLGHKKAVVRLNLLRIVRSICDPTSHTSSNELRSHPLLQGIQRLAKSDNAVLVRNMASELVKANGELMGLDEGMGSGSSTRSTRRQTSRRQSSFTPPGPQSAVSIPMTPTHVGRIRERSGNGSSSSAFMEGSVTPRRLQGVPKDAGTGGGLYRPKSRDGPSGGFSGLMMTRRTSAESVGTLSGSSLLGSRLPRTTMLRTSRSSILGSSVSSSGTDGGLSMTGRDRDIEDMDEPGMRGRRAREREPMAPKVRDRNHNRGMSVGVSGVLAAGFTMGHTNENVADAGSAPLAGRGGKKSNRVASGDVKWS